jgi:hypothetical protein
MLSYGRRAMATKAVREKYLAAFKTRPDLPATLCWFCRHCSDPGDLLCESPLNKSGEAAPPGSDCWPFQPCGAFTLDDIATARKCDTCHGTWAESTIHESRDLSNNHQWFHDTDEEAAACTGVHCPGAAWLDCDGFLLPVPASGRLGFWHLDNEARRACIRQTELAF